MDVIRDGADRAKTIENEDALRGVWEKDGDDVTRLDAKGGELACGLQNLPSELVVIVFLILENDRFRERVFLDGFGYLFVDAFRCHLSQPYYPFSPTSGTPQSRKARPRVSLICVGQLRNFYCFLEQCKDIFSNTEFKKIFECNRLQEGKKTPNRTKN